MRGKPKGATNRLLVSSTELRRMSRKAAKIIEQKLDEGDAEIAKVVYLAAIPPKPKAKAEPMRCPKIAEAAPEERPEMVVQALARGEISPDDAKALSGVMADGARQKDQEAIGYVLRLISKGVDAVTAIAQARAMALGGPEPKAIEQPKQELISFLGDNP